MTGELSLDEETELVLEYGSNNAQWYSFTAPEAGYYSVDVSSASGYLYLDLYRSLSGSSIGYQNISDNYAGSLLTGKMEAGETLYVKAYTWTSGGVTRTLTVKKLTDIAWESQSDGTYLAELDRYKIRLTPEVGCANIRYTVAMEAEDGSSPDGSYTVVCNYNKQNDSFNKTTFNLYSYNDYRFTGSFYAGSGTTYELSFALKDSSGNAIAMFVGELVFTTTGATEDEVCIYDVQCTETSIAMNLERVNANISRCYYAPTERPEEVNDQYISNWMTYTFTELQPGTEYEFQFTNSNGKVLYTTTASTAASDVQISYTSAIAEDGSALNLTASISGYTGGSSYAYLHYEFTDALGQMQTGSAYEALTDGAWDHKSVTVAAPFAADESYDITLWVTIGSSDGTKWNQTVQTVTAPAASASDVTLTVTSDEDTPTTVHYTVMGAGDNGTAYLYYRPQGSQENYVYKKLTLSGGSASGSISGFEAGMTYDFVLSVGGVLRQETVGLAAGTLSLTQVEGGTQEVNAFDLVRTFQLNHADEDTGTYYLRLYCWNGSRYTSIGYTTLSEDNSYQATFKTADYSKLLLPDTEYHLKWTVSTSSATYGTPSCTMYETIHTAAGFSAESASGTGITQSFTVSLENVGNITNSITLQAYIKKKSETFYRTYESVALSASNGYSGTVTFYNLEEETDYEVSWRLYSYSSSYEELATTEFTTTADARQITVTGISSKPHSAIISYTCTGGSSSYSSEEYLLLYIREQGDNNTWELANYYYFYNRSGTFTASSYNGEELKEETTYEYAIGIGDEHDTKVDKLEKMQTGTFQTAKDSRALSGVGVSVRYTSADIAGVCIGSSAESPSYIHVFFREKGESDWSTHYYYLTSSESYSFSRTLTGLKAGTDYEYAVVIADSYSCSSPDEVMAAERKQTGEFTTLVCEYTLGLETVKVTSDSAVISVQAKGSTADSRLQVVLTLSDGQSKTVTLRQSAKYQKSVTFSGLEGSKEYTVTRAVISVLEDGSYEEIGTFECDYRFTTAEAIAPTSITLSKEAVALNAAYANQDFKEGYNGATLKVTAAAPTDAAKDVTWESSNTDVAVVDASGQVTAVGVGTAIITAASKYAEEVTASCEVTVANYVIGQEIDGIVTMIDSHSTNRALYKNGTASGYGLYDRSKEELTIVSEPIVTFSRVGIVSWDNGTLTGITNGTVYVTMEKDGVKAGCYMIVSQEAKGFGITGFTTDSGYPAKETETGYILAYEKDGGITYTAQGELSPAGRFVASDFTWESSDENVAAVDAYGVITPKSAGTVILTVTPNMYSYSNGKYKQDKAEILLTIKDTLTAEAKTIYALANVSKTIGDVDIEAVLGTGWSWKYPKTPLVTNGINTASYPFEAVYTGDAYYPEETTVNVYIGRITGVTVSETGADHSQVLEIGGEDSLTLSVSPIYQGTLESSLYTVEQEIKGGLTVTGENGTYTVTADKAGKHTITFTVKAGDKKLAQTVYNIKAVDRAQVRGITVTSGTDGVTITDNKVILDSADAKQFKLQATAVDRNGDAIDTKLQWKSSDKKVAVAVSGQDTHTAVVTSKGDGHTVITVVAGDDVKYEVKLDVEIQNHAPRVDVSKATVNIAYDYDTSYGKQYASSAGCVEIVPVYGESISSVELLRQGETAETNLKAVRYSGYKYLIQPTQEEIATGIYTCTLRVTTSQETSYEYPLKVSVVDKAPTVSAKMNGAPNLFYLTSKGTINLNISGGYRLDTGSVTWLDDAEGINNGFEMSGWYTYNKKYLSYIEVSQQQIQMADGKLTDGKIATGTLSLKVLGFRKTYTFENFKIKYTYKKPVLTTKNASTTVVPSVGLNSSYFFVYNKTDKTYIYYGDGSYQNNYDELECSSDAVSITTNQSNSRLNYVYSGSAKSEKITLTLNSANWREELQVSHTIKTVQPKAYLANSQLTYNTVSKSTARTSIYIKNIYVAPSLVDVEIRGSNAKAQKLLDDDLLTVDWYGGYTVSVTQNRLNILKEKIPNGTYTYKVTPYYTNADTGEKTALNTLSLKVKVTDKAVGVKASAKGTLDLTNKESYAGYNRPNAKNVVIVDPQLLNAGTEYGISNYKLVGEYSDYFTLTYGYISGSGYHRYITIKDAGKLKAKQSYKLAIECTVQASGGDSFTVTSNTFTIKPKQTAAKIKVINNNQTMYAGANNLTRTYTLSAPSSDYIITSVYGSLDCNKDGIADIVVSGSGSSWICYPTVTITDRDGVSASASGKVLSIPVTVRLQGRDGISVDAKTTIKVKVKR